MNPIRLHQLCFRKIKEYSNILIIGPHYCGKTRIIETLINSHKEIEMGLLFESSIDLSEKVSLFKGFDYLIQDDNQSNRVTEVTNKLIDVKHMQFDKIKNCVSSWLVYDEILDEKIMKEKSVHNILFNGRHLKIWPIFVFSYSNSTQMPIEKQYPPRLPPITRYNFGYIFLFSESSSTNKGKEIIKRYYKEYVNSDCAYSEFEYLMNYASQNGFWLIINHLGTKEKNNLFLYWDGRKI